MILNRPSSIEQSWTVTCNDITPPQPGSIQTAESKQRQRSRQHSRPDGEQSREYRRMASRTRITSLLRTGPFLRPAISIARTAGPRFSTSARPRAPAVQQLQIPGYKKTLATGATIGKPQSDLLVDELQELYLIPPPPGI